MKKNSISVGAALDLLQDGKRLDGYEIDFRYIKVDPMDALKLNQAGADVPEAAIDYPDVVDDSDDWDDLPDGYDPVEISKFVRVNVPVTDQVHEFVQGMSEEEVANFLSQALESMFLRKDDRAA